MATMVEFAQRMLMKRPTVARTSETAIWLTASSPTRAREPRTEITRPKDVTVVEPGICHEKNWVWSPLWVAVLAKRLNRRGFGCAKSAASRSGFRLASGSDRGIGASVTQENQCFLAFSCADDDRLGLIIRLPFRRR